MTEIVGGDSFKFIFDLMRLKKCRSILFLNLLFLIVSAFAFAFPMDEHAVIKTLEKTRKFTLGGHSMTLRIDYVYPDSMIEMSKTLSMNEIPVLLKLLEKDNDFAGKYSDKTSYTKNFKVAQAASFGLASLCGKSIDPILAEVKVQRLDADLAVKNDPLHWIIAFSQVSNGCSVDDAKRAKNAQIEIAKLHEMQRTKAQFEYQRKQAIENETRNRVNLNGMKMLDPAASKTLTLKERTEIFDSSVKSMGLDKPNLTVEQKKLVQKMYDTMVLQKHQSVSAN